jgi:hypothetical protein
VKAINEMLETPVIHPRTTHITMGVDPLQLKVTGVWADSINETLCHFMRIHIHKSRKRFVRQSGNWRKRLKYRGVLHVHINENNLIDVTVNKIINEQGGSILWN